MMVEAKGGREVWRSEKELAKWKMRLMDESAKDKIRLDP
jgi:hypothetical protein